MKASDYEAMFKTMGKQFKEHERAIELLQNKVKRLEKQVFGYAKEGL